MKAKQVRKLALPFPQAAEAPHFDYTSFRIGAKIFANVPPAEEYLHVFVDEAERASLVDLPTSACGKQSFSPCNFWEELFRGK